MVKRLAGIGWQVRAYDIVPERSSVRSVAEAVQGADVVVLNLPTNEAVEDVLEKLIPVVRAPELVVDFLDHSGRGLPRPCRAALQGDRLPLG
jgi:3-hydroxyisobutyrate dehydrogenase-like beta-hydroxyacid dehydrogenase